jgi:hypothetical protein
MLCSPGSRRKRYGDLQITLCGWAPNYQKKSECLRHSRSDKGAESSLPSLHAHGGVQQGRSPRPPNQSSGDARKESAQYYRDLDRSTELSKSRMPRSCSDRRALHPLRNGAEQYEAEGMSTPTPHFFWLSLGGAAPPMGLAVGKINQSTDSSFERNCG